ncbi:hypothetical protein MBM_00097 [Drepanopeziza brunnea f. sp. 'multigermtubi' MB_m1]|uniref:Uncharacterized protein n=1 Tax=Marssonina brunnea f. sp. multigermtubi (strain MB_m1) TaxID=1072389 RepID=K1Y719_MARBU|nr:uncharacterized protein MBM_00097 [Drepanopeziza brunnea f. sp. 'multigermtubi' MB_m1]EKD20984.1 hypothetical protein MBM_00097 [Drepanopeziza brunnea f. sp. 'multigermtubi' MB_m1]
MPSVAEQPLAVSLSPASIHKKRRREDGVGGIGAGAGNTSSKKEHEAPMRFSDMHNRSPYDHRGSYEPYVSELSRDSQRTLLTPKSSRKFQPQHNVKRQRIGLPDASGCIVSRKDMLLAFDQTAAHADSVVQKLGMKASGGSGSVQGTSKVDLRPCHVCRRKPTVKAELEAFGDCESCGERTCYICTRRCEGPGIGTRLGFGVAVAVDRGKMGDDHMVMQDGSFGYGEKDKRGGEDLDAIEGNKGGMTVPHKDQICSGCCLERGPEGELEAAMTLALPSATEYMLLCGTAIV